MMQVMEEMKKLKENDLQTALDIVSLAGLPTHDTLGNILASVWCKYSVDVEKEASFLIEADDLRKILLEQLKMHINSRQALILESEDTVPVVQWIVSFSEQWEKEYRTRQGLRYDISQRVYAVMMETVYVLEDILCEFYSEEQMRQWKQKFENLQGSRFKNQQAIVRSLFRHNQLNHHMCLVASRLLQKKEVCNKSGSYSSRIQRHDITQLADDAIQTLREEVEHINSPFRDIVHWNLEVIQSLTKNTTSL